MPELPIPRECKRLAEVDFPIAAVSRHAAREKSIRHGHPSTLHLWWARRPLASSRAILMALLLPDPVDPACPVGFKERARAAIPRTLIGIGPTDADLREALLQFIGDFADWDKNADMAYVSAARALVRAAHEGETPLVVDPFAGGGSIPLEALRIGCETFASDLNPVACLILQGLLQAIPKRGLDLARELRELGEEIKTVAEKELRDLYPGDSDGARPIAYLWARTVRCESPNCGAEIPLTRSFWLSKKANRRRALLARFVQGEADEEHLEVEVFQPKADRDVIPGTVSRAKATCLNPRCGATMAPDRVRSQLTAQHGGADVVFNDRAERVGGAFLLAVVTVKPGQSGRTYRVASSRDYAVVRRAQERLHEIAARQLSGGLSVIPDEPTPVGGGAGAGRAFSVQNYGMATFGDLFSARQKVALSSLVASSNAVREGSPEAKAMVGFAIGRISDQLSSLVRWLQTIEAVASTFGRPALPIVWDFCEACPIGEESANFSAALEWVAKVVETTGAAITIPGEVQQADARLSPLPDDSAAVWFTDPPYYDAVPYSDLSDYFFVWLKRALPGNSLLRDTFDRDNPLTPKGPEAVQDETRFFEGKPKGKLFFEESMAAAFREGRRILREEGIGCVVFAHKTTEGWEALLGGLVSNGWVITASWPLATERAVRVRARESAALATSIHLICRPRSPNAPIGDWADVARELPDRVRVWMRRLGKEGVRGADLVFACIGPAMEVFSRYSKVLDAQDREIPLGGDPTAFEPFQQGFLAKVWEVVGRLALEQVLGRAGGAGSALEEDARLTALFLWALQGSNGNADDGKEAAIEEAQEAAEDEETAGTLSRMTGFALPYDVVRRFAQPLGIHLEAWEGRIVDTKKGIVRLIPVNERMTQLLGAGGAEAAGEELERSSGRGGVQLTLFPEAPEATGVPVKKQSGRKARAATGTKEAGDRPKQVTTLDRVHAAMLLQRGGQTAALRSFLAEEKKRGADFERLANALAALYPRDTDERRLVEAMLLAMPK